MKFEIDEIVPVFVEGTKEALIVNMCVILTMKIWERAQELELWREQLHNHKLI